MRRAFLLAAGGMFVTFGVVAGCSLGLDESLIDRPDGGGPGLVSEQDGSSDPSTDGSPPIHTPDGGVCTTDDECTTTDGCLKGKCDLTRKTCVFDVCKPSACNSAKCDVAAKTCGAPAAHPYHAGSFQVGAGIGCGGALGRCFAAVYPYLFVGTPNGVVAFRASNPAATEGEKVPLVGLGFLPGQIVASGNRVFFLGGAGGAAPSSRVQIAWLDVPADPFAAKLTATTVLVSLNRPPGEGLTLVPRANSTALLLSLSREASFPSVSIEPPFVEPAELSATPITFSAGMSPVAMSGTRLILQSFAPNGTASFSFVNGAGSPSPQNAGDVALPDAGIVYPPQVMATSPDGALFWNVASLTGAPNPPSPDPQPNIRAARAHFLVGDGNANFDVGPAFDVEVYNAPGVTAGFGAGVVGPAAMLDGKTAIVTTATAGNLAQTSVVFAKKEPLGLLKNDDGSVRRHVLTLPVNELAAAGSNGIGYLLSVDSPTAATIYTFDPACAP
ncbi:hypothetical protein AKJ09_08522 [Labilithrix luteola]|uniref:Uncharacterized protein n=1 Tax=Labilithrix luteola TaxID=1391654 RepID=A0A0K1Q806_9BACT|nr:hypothetical protein [Labilithrix luteola]AKV01859.1 hypothetical protein AKJ09_08522 [Labilithrix luteola]